MPVLYVNNIEKKKLNLTKARATDYAKEGRVTTNEEPSMNIQQRKVVRLKSKPHLEGLAAITELYQRSVLESYFREDPLIGYAERFYSIFG